MESSKPLDSPARVVCCDVDRASIRIAWASDNLDGHEWAAWPVLPHDGKSDTVVESIRAFVTAADERVQDVGICLSVPTRVAEDALRVRDIEWFGPERTIWQSTRSEIEKALNPKAFTIVNDMVALGYVVPELLSSPDGRRKHLHLLAGETCVEGYPIVVVGVRRGIGVAGLVARQDDRLLMVQTEGGSIGLHSSREEEHGILHKLRASIYPHRNREEGFPEDRYTLSAADILPELGLRELVETVAIHFEGDRKSKAFTEDGTRIATVPFENPEQLVNLALGDGPDQAVAAKAIKFWGAYFGAFLRDLALAYGALGGIFIEGDLPLRFLTPDDPFGALEAMNANFEYGGPDDQYLKAIPRIIITHPNPYLKGLARIVPEPLVTP